MMQLEESIVGREIVNFRSNFQLNFFLHIQPYVIQSSVNSYNHLHILYLDNSWSCGDTEQL
jgi:hypothetical protein